MLSIKPFTCIKLSKSSHTSQNMVYEAFKNGIIFLSFFHVLMKCGFIWQYRHFKDAVPAFNAEITEFPSKFLKEKSPLQIWSSSLLILNPWFLYQRFLMILLELVCTRKVTLGERCWPLVEVWFFFFFGNSASAFIDKLLVWRTDTIPLKCLFCQCIFICTERVYQKNDVYTCYNFLFPALHQHTWML